MTAATPERAAHARPVRSWLGRQRQDALWLIGLVGVPPAVIRFQMRARRLAHREGDWFSLAAATRPEDLKTLLGEASGARNIVELGTATGWTALTLALAEPACRVTSFDPEKRRLLAEYQALAPAAARDRVALITAPGAAGPRDATPVDLLYIDSSHERQDTLDEVRAWQGSLAPGARILFDDYGHPDYPGVEQAVAELGLTGRQVGTLFVHEHR